MSEEEARVANLTILPTHNCFSDALEYLGRVVKQDPSQLFGHNYLLIHAICHLSDPRPEEPQGEFAHAWVEYEQGKACTFAGIVAPGHEAAGEIAWLTVTRESFYAEMQPHTITRYTIEEAGHENLRSGHLGPWKECYKKEGLVRQKR